MDTDIIRWAYKFQSLIDGKHQFGRAIDASTKQLIQLMIGGQSSPPPSTPAYTPSKESFQADLMAFGNAVYRQLSQPPPPPPPPPTADAIATAVAKAIKPPLPVETAIAKAVTNAIGAAVKSQTTTLNAIASYTKNIDKNVVGMSGRANGHHAQAADWTQYHDQQFAELQERVHQLGERFPY